MHFVAMFVDLLGNRADDRRAIYVLARLSLLARLRATVALRLNRGILVGEEDELRI